MKILQVYYEPIISGQTTHVQSLSKGLVLRGHDVTVVLPDVLCSVSSDFINAGIKVVILPMHKLFWPMKSILEFLNLLRYERFDIIHVHSQEAGITARALAWIGNSKYIFYTPQTIDIRQKQWQIFYKLFERNLANITKQIFSVNQVDANRLINWGISSKKIRVVPNGIDLQQFENLEHREAICSRLGLKTDYPLVMQIGRLSPQKDPEMFIEGARYLVSRNSEIQLVWIGEGPLYHQVKSEIESLRLQDRIHFLGRVEKAYHCLPAADVVTSTSRWEGLPYSILEAMACSKPVISTAVNGCSEVVINGKTGYLVEAGDALGWAEAILRLIDHGDQARAMGWAGKQLVEEKYSLSDMVTKIEQSYLDNM